MSIDARTAALIAGIVLLAAAVVSALFLALRAPASRAGVKASWTVCGLAGAGLIAWALLGTPGLRLPGATAPAGATALVGPAPAPPRPDLILLAGSALDGCVAPTAPVPPPDGASATRAQLLASQAQAKAFDTATKIYQGCLDTTVSQFLRQYGGVLTATGTRGVGALRAKISNSAVDVDQAVADRFNKQLHVFLARQHH